MNMKQFVRVFLIGGGVYIQPIDDLAGLLDVIKEAEVGEVWHIERIEMTQEDYDKLPEFTGH